MDDILSMMRSCGMRNATMRDASVVMCAAQKMPGLGGQLSSGYTQSLHQLLKCSPIASCTFFPMSFFRLSQLLHSDEFYAHSPMPGCSLDAARNCVDADMFLGILDPHDRIRKVGPVGLFRGMMPRVRDVMSSVLVANPELADRVVNLMVGHNVGIPVSLDDRMRMSKFSSSESEFRVYVPRFKIDGVYTGISSEDALQKALDGAFDDTKSKQYYRRKPKEFTAAFYMMDPVIASTVVQAVPVESKTAFTKMSVGDLVETGSTNGFFGGKKGRVSSIGNGKLTVRFADGKEVSYDMNSPMFYAAIKPIRRL